MLFVVCGIVALMICCAGIVTKVENIRKKLFAIIIVLELIPLIAYGITHFADNDGVKYFKCSRCGEICTATNEEYQYDAEHKTYYLMHDCPRYAVDIRMNEVDKQDALEELRLKNNK